MMWRHDFQHNDTKQNDTRHDYSQESGTQHESLNFGGGIAILSVILLNVVQLSVVAPNGGGWCLGCKFSTQKSKSKKM
jgi:hypothetical protein